jgi:hypothetical protein
VKRVLVSRDFKLVRRKRGRKVRLEIGFPRRSKKGPEWECPIELTGLYERLGPARGIDGFQALMLAQSLARMLLDAEVERGATIHWENGTLTLDELFDSSPPSHRQSTPTLKGKVRR